MSHKISSLDNILTVRISDHGDAHAIHADLRNALGQQSDPALVILDLTAADSFDQNLKAMFFRVLQHAMVDRVGVFGLHAGIARDVQDMVVALQRVRAVTVGRTEHELLAEFGLVDPPTQPRRLVGMLSYLKQQKNAGA